MSLDIFSSLFGSFPGRRNSKKTYGANHRALRLECLETRTVLSATVAAGVVVNNSPIISEIAVSTTKREITWNAAAADGVRSSSIAIDGVTQSSLYGPYKATPGQNYAWVFNSPASGNHTFVITAVNAAGTSTQTSGTFTIAAGPSIGQVAVALSASPSQANITWAATSPKGVASSTMVFDGTAVSQIYGPYSVNNAWVYSAIVALPAEGSHTFAITATDKTGNWSQYNKTFTVGPSISHVAVSTTTGQISWIAADSAGISSSNIVIEGVGTPALYGPYTVSPGLAYSCSYGGLALGTYNYTIIATDTLGDTTQFSGTFTV